MFKSERSQGGPASVCTAQFFDDARCNGQGEITDETIALLFVSLLGGRCLGAGGGIDVRAKCTLHPSRCLPWSCFWSWPVIANGA